LRGYGAEAGLMRPGYASELWKLVRFSAVGALATIVYVVAAMVAVAIGGVAPVVGAVIGFCASFLVSYVGHLRFTFAMPGRYRDYVVKFAVSSLASFLISTITMWIATEVLRIDYKVALVMVAVLIPVCSYLINRFWVFLNPAGAEVSRQPFKTI
jgi:putative flippase GtrA